MDAPSDHSPIDRTLGRLDALAFVITAVVVLDTVGAVAVGGAQSFLWLAVMGLLFLVPSALVTAELSAAFPQEGGHYVWASRAFGRTVGAISSLCYWVESPIWIGGSLAITTVAVVDTFFVHIGGRWALVGVLAFVLVAVGCALLPMRVGRFVPMVGAVARFAVLGSFTIAVFAYGLRHGLRGVRGFGAASPTFGVFAAVAPVLLYNYLGFDVAATAGGEMRDPQRDLPFAVLRGAAWTFLLYLIPVAAVLTVLPTASVTSLHGFTDCIDTVFTVFGGSSDAAGTPHLAGAGLILGDLCAFGLVVVLVTSGATWLMGSVRRQAVACQDGAGPAGLARVRADGTPQRLVLVSGLIATLTAVGSYTASGASADRYFAAALSLSIGAIALSYIAVFAALPRLRQTEPHVRRPYRVPGGGAGVWVVSGLAIAWTIVSLVLLAWPPDLPAAFSGQRGTFELTQLVPLALLVAAGATFAACGRRGKRPSPARVDRPQPLPVLDVTVADQASRLPASFGAPSASRAPVSLDRASLPGIRGTQRLALATTDEGET